MKVAVVGATGLVGRVMLQVLEEAQFPLSELIVVASPRSIGKQITFRGTPCSVVDLPTAVSLRPNIALFSAGSSISLEWAEHFANVGCTVIDNSSAWRTDASKKLIIPEVNGHLLTCADKIIANPNCSTIQLVLTLAPLHKRYSVKRVVVSTYQSVTGTGIRALNQLEHERRKEEYPMIYPYPIDLNCIPHCDDFLENGYTKEEMKLVNETKKILDASIRLTATAVRVPVVGGHSEAVNIQFAHNFLLSDVRNILHQAPGVILKDDPTTNIYPMPKYAEGKNEVFVGRIRRDESQENTLNLWIVADNLRKGAATNAVQIGGLVASLQSING